VESVLRAAAVYVVLLLMVRLTGRRSLRETTPFDLVLLLIVGEAIQQALIGADNSLTHAVVVVATLLLLDVGLSVLKQRLPAAERVLDGVPTLLVADGKPIQARLDAARVDLSDIMEAARERQGLLELSEVRFAVLESDGTITIIPARR
jgi:uncharacterized membrane protein YcaP (DUF421 family)